MSYIMCKTLGRMGRLGNQMFQYALVLGMARKWNLTPTLPYANRSTNQFQNLQLPELFDISVADCSNITPNHVVREPNNDIGYIPALLESKPPQGNIDLYGYFQTEKYFKHIEPEIRSTFAFKNKSIHDQAIALVESARRMSPSGKVVSVHVRRGDYLNHPLSFPFSTQYYANAMQHITSTVGASHFIVASDDIAWCRSFFPSLSRFGTFSYMEGTSMVEDFAMLRHTDHCIVPNSSFSWWGAWLNDSPGKIVTVPSVWFGPRGPKRHDLYCDGWTIVQS